MPELRFPKRLPTEPRKSNSRTSAAHRAWVKRHRCSVPGCQRLPIECAHVRTGTDGAMGLKPSDRWTISLCHDHHLEQHEIGEPAFERRYDVNLVELAREFARRSRYLRATRSAVPMNAASTAPLELELTKTNEDPAFCEGSIRGTV